MNYFSTFTVGTESIVAKILKHHLDDVKIIQEKNGLIRYETNLPVDRITKIPCFNNSFIELINFTIKQNQTIEEIAQTVLKDKTWPEQLKNICDKNKSFRVFFSDKNQTIAIEKDLHEEFEEFIHKHCLLNKNRQHPDFEFWLFRRSEGFASWTLRLTYHPETKAFLQKGELRPELAYIMNFLSDPSKTDIYLDPFAGSGRLALERIKYWDYKRIYVTDNNESAVKKLKKITKLPMAKFTAWKTEAKDLSNFGKNSINKIVTDPPWGDFRKELDIPSLYEGFIKSCSRVLTNEGILVLLTSKPEVAEELIKKEPTLKIQQRFNILVSGHKSALLKVVKG